MAKPSESDSRTDSSRIYPGPSCEHTERIEALERDLATWKKHVADLIRDVDTLRNSVAVLERDHHRLGERHTLAAMRINADAQRIATLERDAAALAELRRVEAKIAIGTALAESVGIVHDRRVTARRTSTKMPRPSKRGKGRRK